MTDIFNATKCEFPEAGIICEAALSLANADAKLSGEPSEVDTWMEHCERRRNQINELASTAINFESWIEGLPMNCPVRMAQFLEIRNAASLEEQNA
jgi:hypothetical protein